jgi:hypothetical protein
MRGVDFIVNARTLTGWENRTVGMLGVVLSLRSEPRLAPDLSGLDALCREHLPDRAATQDEFLQFFGELARIGAEAADQCVDPVVADVVAWLLPEGVVHHHAILRYLVSGQLCCLLDFEIETPVAPADVDAHAEGIASAITAALNPADG